MNEKEKEEIKKILKMYASSLVMDECLKLFRYITKLEKENKGLILEVNKLTNPKLF